MQPEKFLSYLEKIVQLEFSLLLLVSILFFDCYFLIFYKINLLSINYAWLKQNFKFINIILLFSFYSFLISVLIKVVSMIVQQIIVYLKYNVLDKIPFIKKIIDEPALGFQKMRDGEILDDDFIPKDTLKAFAINTNNLPAYNEYLNHLSHIKKTQYIRYLLKLILFFSLLGYLISNKQNPSVLVFLLMKVELYPWYIKVPLKFVFGLCIILAVFYAFDKETKELENYIYLPGVKLNSFKKNGTFNSSLR